MIDFFFSFCSHFPLDLMLFFQRKNNNNKAVLEIKRGKLNEKVKTRQTKASKKEGPSKM